MGERDFRNPSDSADEEFGLWVEVLLVQCLEASVPHSAKAKVKPLAARAER